MSAFQEKPNNIVNDLKKSIKALLDQGLSEADINDIFTDSMISAKKEYYGRKSSQIERLGDLI